MKRFQTIDLCRGLLFILMMNTHALSIAGLPSSSWLFSDFWLPNGWATLVFVVLSGYGVGFLFSPRPSVVERDAALYRRSRQILAVMLVSNTLFAALRDILRGQAALLGTLDWWLGFITLQTDWTISGVLLPTALVLLCGPALIRFTRQAPWLTLLAILLASFLTALAVIASRDTPLGDSWTARFFLLGGLSGFPVLPFVLNGCLGIWLGVQRHQDERAWQWAITALMICQLLIYTSTFTPSVSAMEPFIMTVRAGGKFAWMLVISHLLSTWFFRSITNAIDLLGRFALGSFVLHRVFLQATDIGLDAIGTSAIQKEAQYVILFSSALATTWLVCVVRLRSNRFNAMFRRLAL